MEQQHALIRRRTEEGSDAVATIAEALAPLPVRIALDTIPLAYDVIMNIRRWWIGEITGPECIDNIIVKEVGALTTQIAKSALAPILGIIGGAAAGSFVGAIIGMIVGAIIAWAHHHFISKRRIIRDQLTQSLTQWGFASPTTTVALKKAYKFLGVKPTASPSDINSAYRRLALQYHPDKGGDPDKMQQLHYSLAIIREEREEHKFTSP